MKLFKGFHNKKKHFALVFILVILFLFSLNFIFGFRRFFIFAIEKCFDISHCWEISICLCLNNQKLQLNWISLMPNYIFTISTRFLKFPSFFILSHNIIYRFNWLCALYWNTTINSTFSYTCIAKKKKLYSFPSSVSALWIGFVSLLLSPFECIVKRYWIYYLASLTFSYIWYVY